MKPEHAVYAKSLGLVKEIYEQHKSGKWSDQDLALQQRAFIGLLHHPLALSSTDKDFLTRLSIASPGNPASKQDLDRYVSVYTKNSGSGGNERADVVTEISRLNTGLLVRETGLRIHRMPGQVRRPEGWYLGASTITLEKTDLEIMNLVAAGFYAREIAKRISYSPSAIKNRLTAVYAGLGVSRGTGAALLLFEEGLINTQEIEAKVNIAGYKSLSNSQRNILECLLTNGDAANAELAVQLSISESTIKNSLSLIGNKVFQEAGPVSRVVLAVGYSIYKDRHQDEDQVLTERQVDILKLAAMGLKRKEIAEKLGYAESTIKSQLTLAYQALGVSENTAAVIKLISDGLIDPAEVIGEDLSLFDKLTPLEIRFVENLISGANLSDRRDKILAGELGYSKSTVKNRISVIGEELLGVGRTGVKTRIAVLYLAFKQQQGLMPANP